MCLDQLDTQEHLFQCEKFSKTLSMKSFMDLSMKKIDCKELENRLEQGEKVINKKDNCLEILQDPAHLCVQFAWSVPLITLVMGHYYYYYSYVYGLFTWSIFTISPVLLYGSEVWGASECNSNQEDLHKWDKSLIEAVHIQFLRNSWELIDPQQM